MAGTNVNHQINVTPLADVMLVLLIIFMVVTPMITKGMDVPVPEADHPETHPDDGETLVLSIREDGTVYLNQDAVAREALPATLSSILATRTERVLYLKAPELLDYGGVLAMMDLCRRAGAEEVALITRERATPR